MAYQKWRKYTAQSSVGVLNDNVFIQRNMAAESRKMVTDTQTRLTTAVAELRDLVVSRIHISIEINTITSMHRSMLNHIQTNFKIRKNFTQLKPHSMKVTSSCPFLSKAASQCSCVMEHDSPFLLLSTSRVQDWLVVRKRIGGSARSKQALVVASVVNEECF